MSGNISPIRIDDTDFLVASTIDRCPKVMMIRELARNAMEAAEHTQAGAKRVEFRVDTINGARKLVLWNTGPGMDALELHRMCDLASSIRKAKGLDANFGMGAKVASLPSNREGMIYRSCKDGVVSEVVLCHRGGAYGRLLRDLGDGTSDDVFDVTEILAEQGRDLSYDWTEVTLLGNRADQDTAKDPYDGDPECDAQWLATYLYHRFYRIPADVRVSLNPGTHKLGDGIRHFETIPGRAAKGVFARNETITTESGIKIHYLYDEPYGATSHNRSVSGAIQSALSTVAVVYKDEMYDVKTGRAWTMNAPVFGIPFGARHISIHVELPDGASVLPEGYRQFLRYSHGEQQVVQAMDFAELVSQHRPQWLIDLIRSLAPESKSNDEVRDELQRLLDDLRVTRISPKTNEIGESAVQHQGGMGTEPVRTAIGGGAIVGTPRTRHVDLNMAPTGAKRADLWKDRERAPEIILLRDMAEIDEKQIKGRAARYYDHGQLFVNMTYPAVESMYAALEKEYLTVADLEGMRVEALRLSEDAMVRRVGRGVVYALAKQLNHEWDREAVQQALKPESLSLAADVYMDSLQSARRTLGRLFRPNRQEVDGEEGRLLEEV